MIDFKTILNDDIQLPRITNYKILSAQNKFSESQLKCFFYLNKLQYSSYYFGISMY